MQYRSSAACSLAIAIAVLAGCAPTEVIDLNEVPASTRVAMQAVQIVPLGLPAPPGLGSLGQVQGFACGQTPALAADEAVDQLRIKALRLHATAVSNVRTAPGGFAACVGGYSAVANGLALSARAVPSSF